MIYAKFLKNIPFNLNDTKIRLWNGFRVRFSNNYYNFKVGNRSTRKFILKHYKLRLYSNYHHFLSKIRLN